MLEKVPSDDEFELDGDDPFDTTYVEKVIPKSIDYDDDFDPRAEFGEPATKQQIKPIEKEEVDLFATPNLESKEPPNQLSVLKKDLLSGSASDLTNFVEPIAPSAEEEIEIDPFDTSAVDKIVAPGKTELKYLEKELLETDLKRSLSDPDFDPRALEEPVEEIVPKHVESNLQQRKSSLSLHIHPVIPRAVSFAATPPDLLQVDSETSGKNQKPLTPYYNRKSSLLSNEAQSIEEEEQEVDPFDTSFVPQIAPTKVELDLLEQEILEEPKPNLKHSLSDPDFDPRATTPVNVQPQVAVVKPVDTDLFLAVEHHDIKVLTPAKDNFSSQPEVEIDPFDTSIAINIKPGDTELKLLEDELLDKKVVVKQEGGHLDILSDKHDDSIYIKVLTPQKSESLDLDQADDFDPFDTSFAANLAPGEAEIKVIENEFIN